MKKILVTGGAGFIGSNFVNWALNNWQALDKIIVVDSLTYAGNLANIEALSSNLKQLKFDAPRASSQAVSMLEISNRLSFYKTDIRDEASLRKIIEQEKPSLIANFAAESHVDRSISDPLCFVKTNVEGTQVLLNLAQDFGVEKFLQISTDEVYGSLGPVGKFVETTPLEPSSGYSASKAAADLMVLAAFRTHKLPVCITRCSNNYGKYQFPEKLIPLLITNALEGKPLPIYGDGKNIRSWLHVDDHCEAIKMVLEGGRLGEVYNVGGDSSCEVENIEVARAILKTLGKEESLIKYVEDRKGHDRRYAIDFTKINQELGWSPKKDFTSGLKETINWYLENQVWWQDIKNGNYQKNNQNFF